MSGFESHRLFLGTNPMAFEVRPEQWFCFEDSNGFGYAESDLLLVVPSLHLAFVFECKRTHTDRGLVQLGQLYLPLVRYILTGYHVFGLLVCQNLDPQMNRRYLLNQISDWFDILEKAIFEGRPRAVPLHSLCWRQ